MNDCAAILEPRRHGDRPPTERTFRIGPHLLLELGAVPGMEERRTLSTLGEPVLVWIASGCAVAEFMTADGTGRRVPLQRGDICLATTPLSIRLGHDGGADTPCKAMWLHVGLPLLARTAQDIHGKPMAGFALRDAAGQADDTLATMLALMHAVLKRPVQPCALFMQGMAQALAAHLVRRYAAAGRGTALQGLPPHKLERVLGAMRGSLDEPFNLEDLARQAELSVCHFSRSFKLATGLSPSRYFVQLRIGEARRLLCETAQPVIDVALALGYRSPSHFAQVFREWTGVSPTAYRAGAAGRQRWPRHQQGFAPPAATPFGGAVR